MRAQMSVSIVNDELETTSAEVGKYPDNSTILVSLVLSLVMYSRGNCQLVVPGKSSISRKIQKCVQV